jgi:hypothetical protein
LLVVVAVVATLAGIGIPVGRSVLAKSREAPAWKSPLARRGLESYLQDHNRDPARTRGRPLVQIR